MAWPKDNWLIDFHLYDEYNIDVFQEESEKGSYIRSIDSCTNLCEFTSNPKKIENIHINQLIKLNKQDIELFPIY